MSNAGVHGCAPLQHAMLLNRPQIVVERNFAYFAAQFDSLRDCVPEMEPDVDARVAVFFRSLGEARE